MKDLLHQYLISLDENLFYTLSCNNECIRLIKSFLRRNGIHHDRVDHNEFRYFFFIALSQNRERLLSMKDNTFVEICSVIANLILKEFNRENYARKNLSLEMKNNDQMNQIANTNENVQPNINWNQCLNENISEQYQAAIKSYLGFYGNSIQRKLIPKIFKIKRSTLYAKLNEIKKKFGSF